METKGNEWWCTAAIITPGEEAACTGLLSRAFKVHLGSLNLWVYFLLLEALINEWAVPVTSIIFTLASSTAAGEAVEWSCKVDSVSPVCVLRGVYFGLIVVWLCGLSLFQAFPEF